MKLHRICALALAIGLGTLAANAAAVPITVPRIVQNDGYRLEATGVVSSPPGASSCTALVRVQLQVPNYNTGGWRVVRAIGRHRINVCDGSDSGWTSGGVTSWFGGMWNLRSQPARLCWAATQNVNGSPSQHSSCKRFNLRGGS
ncbi:hypothetical protein [Miltoncostaea oceani]|uniref:hypothetical protein n=1 Tax=Miltoncostaea oceani TaxID=2843216 RepID=UPI001C3C4404|nr:hypothetical protein [Miltoncostaea oceani]